MREIHKGRGAPPLMPVRADASPQFTLQETGEGTALSGALVMRDVEALDDALAGLGGSGPLRLDLTDVTRIDTAGAWALARLRKRRDVSMTGLGDSQAALIDAVAEALPDDTSTPKRTLTPVERLENLGRAMASTFQFVLEMLSYLGLFLSRLLRLRHLHFTSLVHHCHEVGVKAVPIVSLMAFLIGIVLAFQGSAQLQQFGAEVFVVDLIAISILRELGILLTAIIVAGRTGSAFTAAIGSMKMREEIDAMRTLGVDPADALFVPRVLALLLMLPILGLIANVMGLFGGALMSWLELGISPGMFRTRLAETELSHLVVGMVKAPVFAIIIGIVGCHAGMKVESNAESLGQMTSKSVVTAIFAVIVADALFSVFFAQVGL